MEGEKFAIWDGTAFNIIPGSARAVLIPNGKVIPASFLLPPVRTVVFLGNPYNATHVDMINENMKLFAGMCYQRQGGPYFNPLTRLDGESDMDLLKRLYYEAYPDEKPVENTTSNQIEPPSNATHSIRNQINEIVHKSITDTVNRECDRLVERIRKDGEDKLVLGRTYPLTPELDVRNVHIMKEEFGKVLEREDLFIERGQLWICVNHH